LVFGFALFAVPAGLAFESGEVGFAERMSSFVQTFFADAGAAGAGEDAGEDDELGLCAGAAESFCAKVVVAANATLMIRKVTAAKKLSARRFILTSPARRWFGKHAAWRRARDLR
jgi:hypothetical protein